jgi:hypothetical protein
MRVVRIAAYPILLEAAVAKAVPVDPVALAVQVASAEMLISAVISAQS